MKQPIRVSFLLFVPAALFVLLIAGFQSSRPSPRSLVRVENAVTARDFPARFILTFNGGEKLGLEFVPYLNAKGSVTLSVSNPADPLLAPRVIALSNSTTSLSIDRPGEYLFEFSTASRDKVPFDFNLKETNAISAQRRTGPALKIDHLFVEKASTPIGHPRIIVPVLQGDKISISSKDAQQAEMISGKYAQQAMPFNLGKPPVEYTVSFEGIATFELWSDKSAPKFFNLLNRNEGVYLTHLEASVFAPAPPGAAAVSAAEVVSGAALAAKDTAAAKDPMVAMMEMFAQMMLGDTAKELKRTYTTTDSIVLGAGMDFQSGLPANCQCKPLSNLQVGDVPTDFWVFFVGNNRTKALLASAESNLFSSGEDQMKDLLGVFGKKVDKQPDKTLNMSQSFHTSLSSTPEQKAYLYSSEWFEYAILPETAKDSFLQNLPYRPLGTLGTRKTVYDLGNYTYREGLFLCARNKNKLTPVTIHFRYDTFGHQL